MRYKEPWGAIEDYPDGHGDILESELQNELGKMHPLYGKEIQVLAKRQDNDDILVKSNANLFLID